MSESVCVYVCAQAYLVEEERGEWVCKFLSANL